MPIDVTPIIVVVLAMGVALAGMLLCVAHGLNELRRDMAGVRERMARIEGLFEGFIRRNSLVAQDMARHTVPTAGENPNTRAETGQGKV